jgi:hypothetical protein
MPGEVDKDDLLVYTRGFLNKGIPIAIDFSKFHAITKIIKSSIPYFYRAQP